MENVHFDSSGRIRVVVGHSAVIPSPYLGMFMAQQVKRMVS